MPSGFPHRVPPLSFFDSTPNHRIPCATSTHRDGTQRAPRELRRTVRGQVDGAPAAPEPSSVTMERPSGFRNFVPVPRQSAPVYRRLQDLDDKALFPHLVGNRRTKHNVLAEGGRGGRRSPFRSRDRDGSPAHGGHSWSHSAFRLWIGRPPTRSS